MPATIRCRATSRARWLMVVSPALIAAGIWRIDGVLGALGIAGIALLLFARWLGTANLKHLAIAIEAPQRATAGSPYPLRVTLANTRRWIDASRLSITATLPGGAGVEFRTGWIAAGSAADFDGHATPITRAQGTDAALSLTSDFPLGLFSFLADTTHPHRMVVIPRARAPRESPGDGAMLDAAPLAGASPGALGGDLRGLRAWRAGDSPRLISWPATMRAIARGSTPLVRENDPPGFLPQRCLLVLHSFASGGALIRPERFERVLELAGGWIERMQALGIRTRIVADFDKWGARPAATRAEIIRCRECLARATRSHTTEAHELQQAITRNAGDGETVILLSDMPVEFWQDHLPRRTPAPVIAKL